MIVLDTPILVYAVGGPHPAREPSRRLVDAIGAGRMRATTTHAVIQEFTHVFARRRPRAEAASHARRYVALLSPLITSSTAEVEHGLRLYERYAELEASDALLAASALAHEADALISGDAGFSVVPRLRHVAPGTPEFERLLAA